MLAQVPRQTPPEGDEGVLAQTDRGREHAVVPTGADDLLGDRLELHRLGVAELAFAGLRQVAGFLVAGGEGLFAGRELILRDGAAALLERAVELEPGNPVFQQNLLKVTGLVAAAASERKQEKRGLFSRLTGRRS